MSRLAAAAVNGLCFAGIVAFGVVLNGLWFR